MYVAPPPQRSEAGSSSSSGTHEIRLYQVWKGSNIFFLQGRFIFGPDVRSLMLTMFLIVAPVAIFCVFISSKMMDNFSHHWGILITVVAVVFTVYVVFLLLLTSARDPGIIPRNAHPPEPEDYESNIEVGSAQTPQLRLPRNKEVQVDGITFKVKYCDTCMLYRPPRCSHCSICNNCVERFDHHCPWVGQCIGLRNYRFFYMFVFSTTLLCIYIFAFCWVYIVIIATDEDVSFGKAMIKTPASIVLIAYTFISMWFVGGLTAFHSYLICTNQTTYENFRYGYDRRSNPHNKGVVENWKGIFFTSIPRSKNNFREKVSSDPRSAPERPGGVRFISPTQGKGVKDIEMGRKTVWGEIATTPDQHNKIDELNVRNATDNDEERVGIHPRRSSWGRKSGSWEMSPEILALSARIGENRNVSPNVSSLRSENQQT